MKLWSYLSALMSLGLCACSTSSVITPFPEAMQPVKEATEAENYPLAEKTLMPDLKSHDWQLYALELGRVEQLAGQYQKSIETFTPVINAVEQALLAPKVQGSVLLAESGSLLTNDNALPYTLKGYEIILLYQYQALNYLAVGDTQNALIAFRRADELQDYLQSLHQKEIAEAMNEAESKKLNPDLSNEAVLQSTYEAAAGVQSSFQNALTYFLASFAFQASGDSNDALVAMKKSLETAPGNSFVQTALLNLLGEEGDQSDLNQYLKQFNLKVAPTLPSPKNGEVVVMFETGMVPALTQVSFSVSLPGLNSASSFVFPVYPKIQPVLTEWTVSLDGQAAASLQPILSLTPLAAKALSEEYPLIFTRQALRVLIQAGVVAGADEATQNNNASNQSQGAALMIGALATAYSSFMDRADLRSWLLLPDYVLVGVYSVPKGEHSLVFNARQDQAVSVNIAAGQTMLVMVNAAGNTLVSHVSEF